MQEKDLSLNCFCAHSNGDDDKGIRRGSSVWFECRVEGDQTDTGCCSRDRRKQIVEILHGFLNMRCYW